jgi:hypothetical protein
VLPVDLPAGATARDADAATAVFGDFLADPALVELMRIPLEQPLSAEEIEVEMADLVTNLANSPENGRVLAGPERFQAQGQPAVRAVYELGNGALLERALALAPAHLVRVDVAIWPEYRAAYEGLATRVLESLQPLAP